MTNVSVRGYSDRPNIAPGETVKFHVSVDEPGEYQADLVRLVNGDANPAGPGHMEHEVKSMFAGTYQGRTQRTQLGGYVEVPDPGAGLNGSDGFGLHLHLWATTPTAGRQAVLTRWDSETQQGWGLFLEDGYLRLVIGDAFGQTVEAVSSRRLFEEVWYSVTSYFDPASGALGFTQTPTINSVNSRLGLAAPLDTSSEVRVKADIVPAVPSVPVIIAGAAESSAPGRVWVVDNYNGKIDSPKLFIRPLRSGEIDQVSRGEAVEAPLLAHWSFADGTSRRGIPTDDVSDVAGENYRGRCVNQPDRAMTGWNWKGREENFVHAPEEYGAMWFHRDSLDDARWDVDFEFIVPNDLRSGAYAARIRKDGEEDHIPFFVTPPKGKATAKILLLLPTFSYLAYANTQVMQAAPTAQSIMGHFASIESRDLELSERYWQYGLSTYDYHEDGRGCQYSSWKRPIMNMRPRYRHEFGAVWQFPADLHLIQWLEKLGFEYDVLTDHDVQAEGVEAFRRYNVVMTGSHPEYYSWEMIDAWEQFLAEGGRGMYLAANGMYWITSPHPEKPWLVEVRKGESGDQAWRARPGELYHSTSGERGGIWRHRARPPQKVWGSGYTSHGLDVSTGYHQMPDSRDERVDWIFEGIDKDEIIGDFGLIGGGAAGLEVDRYDISLGTPPHTLLLASSHGHSANAMLVPEDQYFAHPAITGIDNPMVRSDITYFTTPKGGAMWASSSMAWCGSLLENDGNNNVSRMTSNILSRFADDTPVPEVL